MFEILNYRGSTGWSTKLPRLGMLVLAFVCAVFGPRRTYVVFEAASGVMGVVFLTQVVPRTLS